MLLHYGEERRLVRMKGDGPKFFLKTALETMGYFYLGFEIASFDPVLGIDSTKIQSLNRRKFTAHPYFTSLQKLLAITRARTALAGDGRY